MTRGGGGKRKNRKKPNGRTRGRNESRTVSRGRGGGGGERGRRAPRAGVTRSAETGPEIARLDAHRRRGTADADEGRVTTLSACCERRGDDGTRVCVETDKNVYLFIFVYRYFILFFSLTDRGAEAIDRDALLPYECVVRANVAPRVCVCVCVGALRARARSSSSWRCRPR